MGFSSLSGRARTSPSNPQAHGICDRCGFRFNHVDLKFQYDWRGSTLQNIQLLVCGTCYDRPQDQLRAITLPADPVPISNPRVQDFVAAENMNRVTSGQNTIDPVTGIPIIGGDTRITQNEKVRVAQQTGEPYFGLNTLPGTSVAVPTELEINGPGLPYENTTVPSTGPST